MALDVTVPDPPSLRGPQSRGAYESLGTEEPEPTDDYRRDVVRVALREGAWRDAFAEWTDHTYLAAAEFETAVGLGLFEAFDFYWDPAGEDVGYRAPTVPDDERDRFPDGGANGIDEELDALGRTVSAVLERDYLDGEDDAEFDFFAEDEERETVAEREEDEA
ncbi:hypothetical protein [Halobaculum lipolyticum]|uniref:DUF7992 domain-containing protein n=1 Tax=Halobaculum lipolyticum TaxID=3032001 RepID=A0ABD5WFP2_9EURY|nr:hypothetical protein [Halobaculum sp. DT31]